MLFLGALKMGKLIRFIPFPVVGGLLAGAGWLLLVVSFNMMTGIELKFDDLANLFTTSYLVRWLPGLAIAGILLWVDEQFKNPISIPCAILLCFVGFFLF